MGIVQKCAWAAVGTVWSAASAVGLFPTWKSLPGLFGSARITYVYYLISHLPEHTIHDTTCSATGDRLPECLVDTFTKCIDLPTTGSGLEIHLHPIELIYKSPGSEPRSRSFGIHPLAIPFQIFMTRPTSPTMCCLHVNCACPCG